MEQQHIPQVGCKMCCLLQNTFSSHVTKNHLWRSGVQLCWISNAFMNCCSGWNNNSQSTVNTWKEIHVDQHQNQIFNKLSKTKSVHFTASSWKISHGLHNDQTWHGTGGLYVCYWETQVQSAAMMHADATAPWGWSELGAAGCKHDNANLACLAGLLCSPS